MATYATMSSQGLSDDNIDDNNEYDDDTKRKSRNLSEKKRRDQFNVLVNELGSMISTNARKWDKSTVLKATISFLKSHNEIAVRSRVHEIQEDWKPSFLSNEEFTHLILEALDGFIMVFSSNGKIYYASESVTSLLGYLPSELANSTIYELTYQEDQSHLYNIFLNPSNNHDQHQGEKVEEENQVSFTCHIKRGTLDSREENTYECVNFVGYFRSSADIESLIPNSRHGTNSLLNDTKMVFVGTGRLQTPQLIQDTSLVDGTKSEFTSRHSLEWKFLFLDHRAPPIIGYLPFEVLGTSGYDYYHVDDLDKVVACHESLMQKGEGTSCYYRFLTKGQQWIWLQTRFYIDYNQWNSKPEFIVCTHNVVNYSEVVKQLKKNKQDRNSLAVQNQSNHIHSETEVQLQVETKTHSTTWLPKSTKTTRSVMTSPRGIYHGAGSDTSISVGSQSSRHSALTSRSSKPVVSMSTSKQISQTPPEGLSHRINHGKNMEFDPSCSSYIESQGYSTESILSIGPGSGFITPAVPISLPTTLMVNQQNIPMTTAQNQIQDELQRKHEELQQLIVHQQEELRRISEQLLIARYGIISPNVNPNLNYDYHQSLDASQIQEQVHEMGPLTIPASLLAPLVPVEGFNHTAAAIPVATSVIPPNSIAGLQINSGMAFIPQLQSQTLPLHGELPRHDQPHLQHVQQSPTQMQEHLGHAMSFQICQQSPMLHNNVDSSVNGLNRSSGN